MSNILVTTDQQILRITEAPRIAAEGVNENYVIFTFDESWDGYGKTVLFFRKEDDTRRYISVVDGEGKALVPNAVTEEEGVFCFSVTGTKDDVEYTSEIVKYQVFRGMNATRSGTPTPTPDVYTQIMQALGNLQTQIEGVADDLDQAVNDIEDEIDGLRNDTPVKADTDSNSVGIGVTPSEDNTFEVNEEWVTKVGEIIAQKLTLPYTVQYDLPRYHKPTDAADYCYYIKFGPIVLLQVAGAISAGTHVDDVIVGGIPPARGEYYGALTVTNDNSSLYVVVRNNEAQLSVRREIPTQISVVGQVIYIADESQA